MEGYLYHYVAVPSARNNTLASINQEKNSIDQIVQTYKGKELAPEEKKILSDFDAAWPEMQRGYKEIMKVADDGKNDEVARLLADGSYLIKARKNTWRRFVTSMIITPAGTKQPSKQTLRASVVGRVYCGYC
jgi:hypothetical protein